VYADKLYTEENRATSEPFFASILNGIGEAIINNLPHRFKVLGEMIKDKLAPKAFDMVKKHIQIPDNQEELSKHMLCLNHGDFWSNNILFKYNEKGEPVASALIDFQVKICPFYLLKEQLMFVKRCRGAHRQFWTSFTFSSRARLKP
jgi:hypothetical protein